MTMKVTDLKSLPYSLTLVNSVFVLTGIILLIVSSLVLQRHSNYDALLTSRFLVVPGLAVGTGVCIIFISVLGSFAAVSEKFYLIIAYVVLMLIVLVFELSLTISGFNLNNEITWKIKTPMEVSMWYYEEQRDVAKMWDDMQREFQCCGVNNVESWQNERIPLSCCYIDYGTNTEFKCRKELAYPEGCLTALSAWLGHNAHVLTVTVFVFTCVQTVLVGIAGWLAWQAKSSY